MKVRWSDEALEQLAAIQAYISKDSRERAERFISQIVSHAEGALVGHPLMGRIVPEVANPLVRELIFKGYRIIYKVSSKGIRIVTVFEGHRMLRGDQIDS